MKAQLFNIQRFSIHDGNGIRTTFFFKGCPLNCRWCSNPECNLPYQSDKRYSLEELMKIALADVEFYKTSGGGVTLSGGEPLQHPMALDFLKALKSENIHTCVETSGYVTSSVFAEALPYIDQLYYDFKHPDTDAHKEQTDVGNGLILENAKIAMDRGANLVARIPVIKGYNDTEEATQGYVTLFQKLGIQCVHLLPFHQFGEKKWEELGLTYALKGIPSMKEEELYPMQMRLSQVCTVQIGG